MQKPLADSSLSAMIRVPMVVTTGLLLPNTNVLDNPKKLLANRIEAKANFTLGHYLRTRGVVKPPGCCYSRPMYRHLATSIPGFVQQLAVCYLRPGYFFYVAGCIKDGKVGEEVDQRLLVRYGIARSRWSRARRKKAGEASLQDLRYQGFWVLLATHGRSPFFEEERNAMRDFRREPLLCFGLAISHKEGHPHVRIACREMEMLRAHFLARALSRRAERLEREFRVLPFEPYAPVRAQLGELIREVNRSRKKAGLEAVEEDCVRARRRICRPFDPEAMQADRRWEAYFARFPRWKAEGASSRGEGDTAEFRGPGQAQQGN